MSILRRQNKFGKFTAVLAILAVVLLLGATLAYAQAATSGGASARSPPKEVLDKLPKAGGNGTIAQSGNGTGNQGVAAGSGGQVVTPVIDEKSIYRLPPESASSGPTNPNTNGVTGVATTAASASPTPAPSGSSSTTGSPVAEQGQPVLVEPSTALPSEVVPAASTKPDVKPAALPETKKQNEQSLTARISSFFKRLFRR